MRTRQPVPSYVRAEEMHLFASLADSCFWPFVQKGDGCWIWTGATMGGRYGKVVFDCGRWCHAHRFSYFIHCGPIPPGMFVCHECDNPQCTDPACLFLGTHTDNMRDMRQKGRAVSGSQKLALEDIEGAARRWETGETLEAIGADLGVCHSTLSNALGGKFKYCRGVRARRPARPARLVKLTPEQVAEIMARASHGETQECIALDYGVARSTVSDLTRGKHSYGAKIDRPDRPSRPTKLTLDQAREIVVRSLQGETQESIAADYGINRSTVSYLVRGKYKYAGVLL